MHRKVKKSLITSNVSMPVGHLDAVFGFRNLVGERGEDGFTACERGVVCNSARLMVFAALRLEGGSELKSCGCFQAASVPPRFLLSRD